MAKDVFAFIKTSRRWLLLKVPLKATFAHFLAQQLVIYVFFFLLCPCIVLIPSFLQDHKLNPLK